MILISKQLYMHACYNVLLKYDVYTITNKQKILLPSSRMRSKPPKDSKPFQMKKPTIGDFDYSLSNSLNK
jgi:hypothetical protein